MGLTPEDIELFAQMQQQGEMPDMFFETAMERATKQSEFKLEAIGTAIGSLLGLTLLSWPGAIAALLFGGGAIINKLTHGKQLQKKLMSGDQVAIAQ